MIAEIVTRYSAGEKTPALSLAFGIHSRRCRDLLRAEGLSLRGHAITAEEAEQAVLLYEQGLTITAVAAQIGYSHGTIRTARLKHGVTIRLGVQGNPNGVE